MIFKNKTIKLAVNPVFYNLPVIQANFNNFKDKINNFINSINFSETEEFNKNIIRDFIKDSFYNDYYVNTSDRIDLAIYSGKTQDFPLAVIFEVKKPLTTTEMVTESNFAKKAFYELVLYYLREKISNNNHSVQSLIITDAVEWFVFDSRDFERLFARNNALVNEYKNWVGNLMILKELRIFTTKLLLNILIMKIQKTSSNMSIFHSIHTFRKKMIQLPKP